MHDQIDFFDYFASFGQFGQNGHAFFSNAVFKKMSFLRAKRWLFVRYYLDVLDTTTDSFPTYYLLTSYYDVQDGREMVAVRIYSSLLVIHYYLLTTLRFFICVYRKKAVPLQQNCVCRKKMDSNANTDTIGVQNNANTNLSSASGVNTKKVCYAPIKHNRLRRKYGHDYAGVCIYLISVNTINRQRILGTLVGNSPDEARIEPSPLGEYVATSFSNMAKIVTTKTNSRVQVLQYQIMPDHFHGILYVRDPLPNGWNLSRMIAAWKGDCSREYWRLSSLSLLSAPGVRPEKHSLFEPNFNDKILFHEGQLQTWYNYLHDNPRRLWLKIHYPDRLRKIYDFIAGKQEHRYTAIGNTFNITYPERVQVRCHRNLSDEEMQREVSHYLGLARSGAILVSPYISPAEKAVYDACYREKLRMIRIVKRGLDGKFIYPSGRDLKGCSDGFLLVLSPYFDYSQDTSATRISRSQCLDMNAYAADLSTITAFTRDEHY